MPEPSAVADLVLTVDGKEQPDLVNQLVELRIDRSVHAPDMFEIRLQDPHFELFDKAVFVPGTTVAFELKSAGKSGGTEGMVVAAGMVPAAGGGVELWAHGYDAGYRLTRRPRTRTYTDVTDADIVSTVLGEYTDLDSDVDSAAGTHEYVIQAQQTDWDFLSERAWRSGCDLWVDGTTLHFARRPTSTEKPPVMTWGENLVHLDVRMSAAAATHQVTVTGWDPRNGTVVTATADSSDPGCTADAARTMADAARRSVAFGEVELTVGQHGVGSTEEATTLARSMLDRARSTEVRLTGRCEGDPTVAPGATVTLDQVGRLLAGDYLVTGVTHVFGGRRGYLTTFRCGSRVGDGLVGMMRQATTSASGAVGASPLASQLVIATVTNNKDPDGLGRVKVSYHLSDKDESPWAPVLSPGKGVQCLPEKDDHVVVGFLSDDLRQPVVFGVVFSNAAKPPVPDAGDGARTTTHRFGAGDSALTFDTRTGKLTLTAKSIELKADQEIKIKGQTVNLNPPG